LTDHQIGRLITREFRRTLPSKHTVVLVVRDVDLASHRIDRYSVREGKAAAVDEVQTAMKEVDLAGYVVCGPTSGMHQSA
jgi:hypothetical protein